MSAHFSIQLPPRSAAKDCTLPEPRWVMWTKAVSNWPKPISVAVLLGLVLTVGWVDYATGMQFSVLILYLVPVAIGTWIMGRWAGTLVALVSAGTCTATDLLARGGYDHWLISVWNALMLAVSFLVLVVLLGWLRQANELLEQTVERRTRALQAENTQRRRAEEDLRHALSDVRKVHTELQQLQLELVGSASRESAARLSAELAQEVKTRLTTLSRGVDYFLNRQARNPQEARLVQEMKESVHRVSSSLDVFWMKGCPPGRSAGKGGTQRPPPDQDV